LIPYFSFQNKLREILDDKKKQQNGAREITVNVHAVVKAFNLPSQTRRGEWRIEATLVDDTCPDPVTLPIFRKNRQDFPKFASMGDVIRIHRAKLEVRWTN
jgi:Telomeric single stranded DNA binding POT1/CDC13